VSKYNDVDILLVEDNPHDVELALRALKESDLTKNVHVVNDGEGALDFLFSRGKYADRTVAKHPRMVFLDINLPNCNGLEVLKAIKDDDERRFIPVVILTSSLEESDLIESYRLGVNSYIVKPVDFDAFARTVRTAGTYWLRLNRLPG
jgi:two-component system, response regulator